MVTLKRRKLPDPLPDLAQVSPLLQRIYAARGIISPIELETHLSALLPYHSLLGIEAAVKRFETAFHQQEHIMIIGDFDADGATSTALAVSALRAMGAAKVSYLVPNRFIFGYGLTPELVDLASQSQPSLIVTVDNGISSLEGAQHAKTYQMDVIITDHHLPGTTLPDACAIVNPNQAGDCFSSKHLAGVGVIFYVMAALRRHLEQQGWFKAKNLSLVNMAQYLDLVALGTVADVVPLDQCNRILVHQGISRIRLGAARPGIQALIDISAKTPAHIRAHDLGFSIAPRLNAAGRLDDMGIGIQCLLCESLAEAQPLAQQLNSLNEERRLIEQEMRTQALHLLEKFTKKLNRVQLPAGLCLLDKSFHQGVIGILAGRLKEQFHRPVIVFTQVNASELKASGRSVPSLNLRDILAHINQENPGLMTKFGGHAMAAGITMPSQHFERFRQHFEAAVSKQLPLDQCQGELWTDGPLLLEEFNLNTAHLLANSGPWGQHFPEPVFEGQFHLLQQRLVGKKHLKLTLKPVQSEQILEAIAFNVNLRDWPNERARQIHGAFTLEINQYQGIGRLQLVMQHLQRIENTF